jgi:cytochrome c556
MVTCRGRLASAALLVVSTLADISCVSKASQTPASAQSDLAPYVSIKELMENVIDPIADNIFDAVVTDISTTGTVDTKPVTDEDWARVRQGAVTLAEGTNLLKIPRRVAPPGETNKSIGPNAPELSPEQIQAKIDQDRALWNARANELRDDALKVLEIVKARDADALFRAGSEIDKACENCHLEYWYPGDKKAVLEDEQKHVTVTPPKKKV